MSKGDDYNFYKSIYQNDISRWGGRTFRKPENISREMDVSQMAANSQSVSRCLNSMKTTCRPVCTPTSLYRASYVPHMPTRRGPFDPSYSNRCPESPPLPNAPDPSVLRPSTEYGSRYVYPHPKPYLSQDLVERCSTAAITTRNYRQTNDFSPQWDTTYRKGYCEKAMDAHYSPGITFHSTTNLR